MADFQYLPSVNLDGRPANRIGLADFMGYRLQAKGDVGATRVEHRKLQASAFGSLDIGMMTTGGIRPLNSANG